MEFFLLVVKLLLPIDVAASITDTRRYVPAVTLPTQDKAKLLEQIKYSFKITINLNKYKQKVSAGRINQYLHFLIDQSLQWVNRLFVLSFQNEVQRTSYKWYYIPTREIKNCNVMIDGQNFFNQTVRNDLITLVKIRKVATDQGDLLVIC